MKKVAVGVVLIISLVIINNLARSILSLWQKQELVVKTEKELLREKKMHTSLKEQELSVKDPTYLEKMARNKLFLAKPNEQIVILPNASEPEKSVKGAKKLIAPPNWKAWLGLFSFSVSN